MEPYLNEAPCLYFSSSDDGIIIECNQTLCQRLGYTSEELIGQKLEKIFTVGTRIFQQTHFFPLLKMQGFAEEIFITLLTKENDHLPVLINAKRKTSHQDSITEHVGIVVYNRKKFEDELVTARKAAESALNENTMLQQAKQELQKNAELLDKQMHKVKMLNAELLQFNRVVTHDLQEPLRKLFVFTNILLESEVGDTNTKTISRIRSVSEQMRAIIYGLQQYVWLTEADIKPAQVDLQKLLLLVKAEVEKENAGIDLKLTVTDLPLIVADREQIHFMLHEILSNAVRFRKDPYQAFIKVSANTLLLNQFKSMSGKYKYGEYLRLELKDEGIGFDVTYKDQVFELFKRLHPVSGRGVGLSLCKKIVENHNGMISIDSQTGEGTTLSIFLPLQEWQPEMKNTIENYQTSLTENER